MCRAHIFVFVFFNLAWRKKSWNNFSKQKYRQYYSTQCHVQQYKYFQSYDIQVSYCTTVVVEDTTCTAVLNSYHTLYHGRVLCTRMTSLYLFWYDSAAFAWNTLHFGWRPRHPPHSVASGPAALLADTFAQRMFAAIVSPAYYFDLVYHPPPIASWFGRTDIGLSPPFAAAASLVVVSPEIPKVLNPSTSTSSSHRFSFPFVGSLHLAPLTSCVGATAIMQHSPRISKIEVKRLFAPIPVWVWRGSRLLAVYVRQRAPSLRGESRTTGDELCRDVCSDAGKKASRASLPSVPKKVGVLASSAFSTQSAAFFLLINTTSKYDIINTAIYYQNVSGVRWWWMMTSRYLTVAVVVVPLLLRSPPFGDRTERKKTRRYIRIIHVYVGRCIHTLNSILLSNW